MTFIVYPRNLIYIFVSTAELNTEDIFTTQFNLLAFYACFFNPRCACISNIVISKITTTMQNKCYCKDVRFTYMYTAKQLKDV